MNWYSAESTDPFGETFFSHSLFHSKYFLVASFLNLVTLLACVWLFIEFKSHLPPEFFMFIFVVAFMRALSSLSSAAMRHKSLRDIYFENGKIQTSDSHANAALGVAARAILDDVFYTSIVLLAFLYMTPWLLRHAS